MRLLSKDYMELYSRAFRETLQASADGVYDDTALPSYTHRNRLMSWLFWKRIDTALSLAGELGGRSVLDFGCGGGVTFKYLHEQGCEIVGCDKYSAALASEMCERFGIEAQICDDLFEIKGRTFDVILALDVLEHVHELDRLIEGFRMLSHDETRIIVSGPTESLPYRLGRRLAGFTGDYHVRSVHDIEGRLRQGGLRRSTVRRLYLPFPLFRISVWHK